ncbi:hypothetical protein AX15_003373 [Amanita polypyramis BW_CC]|nr:hypothetical protein AX15_003373 [Amanita polypyramis BW_CC]
MPCNWLFVGSNAFRSLVQSTRAHGLARQPSTLVQQFPGRFFATDAALAGFRPTKLRHESLCPEIIPRPSLTEAQMSRAASRAIHQCLQLQSLSDAYYIFNSLRYSNFRHQKSLIKFTGVRSSDDFESAAMQFGRPVSPRLSSHTLLHGLLRVGLTKKAYKLTCLMINDGMKVRSKSLEAVMQGFYPTTPPKFTPARPVNAMPRLCVSMAQDEGTRMALSLLMLAQKSWHRRTRTMYKALLALCILNGELILGSLLFGYMIRHWQSQMALDGASNQQATATNTDDVDPQPGTKCCAPSRLREDLRPSAATLQPLLVGIKVNLERASESEESQPGSVQAALQTLAILANMLDQHELPIADLSFLIHTLYNVPKFDYQVWVTENGQQKRKKAYNYFHRVLKRFIRNIRPRTSQSGQSVMPALDLPAYNALLYYALRHRLSPDLGNKVLNHMVNERRPSLKPDITTYNTIIRSGTVIRNSEIVEQALSVLRQNPRNDRLVSVKADEPIQNRVLSVKWTTKATGQDRDVTWTESISLQDVPEMDSTTLCLYITYLIAIGQPHKAATLFSLLIPELRRARSKLPPDERKAVQEAYLKKAIQLGPYVFTALLTALYKAGKCGLAERVWLVALTAERASHDPKYDCQPWTLPVHAYTIMMQCYGAQIRNYRPAIGWARLLSPSSARVGSLQRRIAARHLARVTYELAKSHSARLDARFFNATLRVFARHPETGRLLAARRQTYRRHWDRSQREYAWFGRQSRLSHPIMSEIGQDILDAGYEIPAAYRHMLVGHISPSRLQWQSVRVRRHQARAYAYPSDPLRSSALSIPTVKRSGLPIRRRFRPRARHHPSSYLSCKAT